MTSERILQVLDTWKVSKEFFLTYRTKLAEIFPVGEGASTRKARQNPALHRVLFTDVARRPFNPYIPCVLYPFTMAKITENGFNARTTACETNLCEVIPRLPTGDLIQEAVSQVVGKPVSTCKDAFRPQPTGGRRSKFAHAEDMIILREVSAAKAHIAPLGQTRERFEIASSKATASSILATEAT